MNNTKLEAYEKLKKETKEKREELSKLIVEETSLKYNITQINDKNSSLLNTKLDLDQLELVLNNKNYKPNKEVYNKFYEKLCSNFNSKSKEEIVILMNKFLYEQESKV